MDKVDKLETCPPDLIAFYWAETLSTGEQSVLLASSLRRLQNRINASRTSVAAPPPLLRYVDHLRGCASYTNNACTCGLENAMRELAPSPVAADRPLTKLYGEIASRCFIHAHVDGSAQYAVMMHDVNEAFKRLPSPVASPATTSETASDEVIRAAAAEIVNAWLWHTSGPDQERATANIQQILSKHLRSPAVTDLPSENQSSNVPT